MCKSDFQCYVQPVTNGPAAEDSRTVSDGKTPSVGWSKNLGSVPQSFLQFGQPVNTPLVRRMSSAPFRPRLVQLNLERGIRGTMVLLGVGEVASGATVLAEFEIRHFPQAFANSLYVFRLGLNHVSSRGMKDGKSAFIPRGLAVQGQDKSGKLSHRPGSRLRAVSNKPTASFSLPSVEGIFARGKTGRNR